MAYETMIPQHPTPLHAPAQRFDPLVEPDTATDGMPDADLERIAAYARRVAAGRAVDEMRADLPSYLDSRENREGIDTVLAEYDPLKAMSVLSDAAQLRVFHDTLDALLPGSRYLENAGDIANPDRILSRVSSAIDTWAAQGRPMGGPDYSKTI